MVEWLFWGAVALLAHTYFLYPVVLILLDGALQAASNFRFARTGKERRFPREAENFPTVSLVVAAHNEATCIEEKVRNSLALNYPAERFELVIGSDGSDDGTDALVKSFSHPRVVLAAAPRSGKAGVLNRCIPEAKGEIVVLSDANTELEPNAIVRLVRHFQNPEVGAVCGRLVLFNPTRGEYEESAYWAYESLIKLYEGKWGAVMGANGGLYAIRRGLFRALPPSTITDDFVIPLRILEQGYQVLYEPEALAHEATTEDYRKEFGRRARIAAGNFQSLKLVPGLLSPARGFRAFAFVSHKLLRWCAPGLMALALGANAALVRESTLYGVLLVGQVAFYSLALLGRMGWLGGPLRRVASLAYYFVAMNGALAVGFWRFLRSSQSPAWERTARA